MSQLTGGPDGWVKHARQGAGLEILTGLKGFDKDSGLGLQSLCQWIGMLHKRASVKGPHCRSFLPSCTTHCPGSGPPAPSAETAAGGTGLQRMPVVISTLCRKLFLPSLNHPTEVCEKLSVSGWAHAA